MLEEIVVLTRLVGSLSLLVFLLLVCAQSFALDPVEIAVSQIGRPYIWGGNGPESFDCSGLTRYVFQQAGAQIPRTALAQFQIGSQVTGTLQRNDLLFFATDDERPGVVTHVGIYENDNNMIDANSYAGRVTRDDISTSYWAARFLFARRVLPSQPSFDFALDSIRIAGNANGGAGFFDDFNDGSITAPPTSSIACFGEISESGGFLRLNSAGADRNNPGFLIINCALSLNDPNDPVFRLTDGAGDAVVTASFRADDPGQAAAGLQIFTLGGNEIVNMNFSGPGPFVVALARPGVFQDAPLNLTGVQRIMLRLTFHDSTNEVTHAFSLDNGLTFTNFVFPQPGKVMTTGNQAIVSFFASVQR